MSFVRQLVTERSNNALHVERRPAKHGVADKKPNGRAVDLGVFADVHVTEKVLRDHAQTFKPLLKQMAALAKLADGMEPYRAKTLGRTLEAFYAKVGSKLSQLPEADRKKAAAVAIESALALVQPIERKELIAPALGAMMDLINYSSDPVEAKRGVHALLAATEGRTGAASALNVFPNIIWHLEHHVPLEGKARFDRWVDTATGMANALPRTRFDQIEVANLAALVATELAKAPKEAALARATKKIHAEGAKLYADVRAHAKAVPANLARTKEPKKSYDVIAKAVLAAIETNPAGPASLAKAFDQVLTAIGRSAVNSNAERLQGWEALAEVLRATSETPSIEAAARFIAAKGQSIAHNKAAVLELGKAKDLATGILRATLVSAHLDPNNVDLKRVLDKFAKLPPSVALEAALAISMKITAGKDSTTSMIAGVVEVASTEAPPGAVLETICDRYTTMFEQLRWRLNAEAQPAVSLAVARTNPTQPLEVAHAQQIGNVCQQVQRMAPKISLAELLPDDAEKRPGLISLAKFENARWQQPVWYLTQLLRPLEQMEAPSGLKLSLARHAMSIANEIAKLDRDPNTVWNTITADWQTALDKPGALHFGAQGVKQHAVRAKPKAKDLRETLRFIEEHNEIPPELLFTAGVKLNARTVAWLTEVITTERSRMQIRNYRDAAFAAIGKDRKDLLEAMRTTKVDRSTLNAVATFIAAEYRAGRLNHLPADRIIAELRRGRDPMVAIEKARARGGAKGGGVDAMQKLAQVEVAGMGAVRADQETIASLKRAMPDLKALLQALPANGRVNEQPGKVYRKPITDCIEAMVDGTWPEVKYDNPAGKRALKGLTPEQKEIWMTAMITPLKGVGDNINVAARNTEAVKAAITLLRGLTKALPLDAKLGEGLAFDAATAKKLGKELEETIDALRASRKGSQKHRELSAKAGPIAANLAVIELQLELEKHFGGKRGKVDGAAVLHALDPLLHAAKPAARKLGGRASSEAISQIIDAIPPPAKQNPRKGVYAADDDNIEAWVTSFDSGCISSTNGMNRHSQAEFISGAQYRMLRVCTDEHGYLRSMYRLYRVKMQGYEGHGIWMDAPNNVGRGRNPTQEMQKLAYMHGMKKAMAMGVPFFFSTYSQPAQQAAQTLGLAVNANANVKMSIDKGNTGLHHCQGIQGGDYFVAWPEAAEGAGYENAGKDVVYTTDYQFAAIMPPKKRN